MNINNNPFFKAVTNHYKTHPDSNKKNIIGRFGWRKYVIIYSKGKSGQEGVWKVEKKGLIKRIGYLIQNLFKRGTYFATRSAMKTLIGKEIKYISYSADASYKRIYDATKYVLGASYADKIKKYDVESLDAETFNKTIKDILQIKMVEREINEFELPLELLEKKSDEVNKDNRADVIKLISALAETYSDKKCLLRLFNIMNNLLKKDSFKEDVDLITCFVALFNSLAKHENITSDIIQAVKGYADKIKKEEDRTYYYCALIKSLVKCKGDDTTILKEIVNKIDGVTWAYKPVLQSLKSDQGENKKEIVKIHSLILKEMNLGNKEDVIKKALIKDNDTSRTDVAGAFDKIKINLEEKQEDSIKTAKITLLVDLLKVGVKEIIKVDKENKLLDLLSIVSKNLGLLDDISKKEYCEVLLEDNEYFEKNRAPLVVALDKLANLSGFKEEQEKLQALQNECRGKEKSDDIEDFG